MQIEKHRLNGLYIFKELIKMGCEWHGDTLSRRWSECLNMPNNENEDNRGDDILEYLSHYEDGIDYLIRDYVIWIA